MTTAELILDHSAADAAERKQETRKVLWAFLAALVLHLIVAFLLAAWSGVLSSSFPAAEKPMELTFVDLATPAPIVPKNSMFIENDESKQVAEPAEKTFESNANSIGASEIAANGAAPLPAQEGKERPVVDLETHAFSLPVEGAQPQPSAPPQQTPQQTPQPSQAPTATPPPDQLAMLMKTPTPPPVAQSTPAPPRQPKSSYRALKEQTRIRGNISNRGISSVNAVGTPLGRYQKYVLETIGSRWYAFTAQQTDLFKIGNLQLRFYIDRSGHVKDLKIIENTSNEAFANICLQSVIDAQFPPIPNDVADTLPPQGLEMDGLNFIIFPN